MYDELGCCCCWQGLTATRTELGPANYRLAVCPVIADD